MKKIFTLFLVTIFSLGLVVGEASAKRMGGGKSFGKQRESVSQSAPKAPAAAPTAPAPAGGNKWLGPLAGLAAGGLLASLLMGGGFDGIKMMDILMMLGIGAAIFFIFRAMRNRSPAQPMPAAAGNVPFSAYQSASPLPGGAGSASVAAMSTSTRPAWFEDEPFLRQAKANFLRLQDANDKGDVNDIREFTTPEMFAEIGLQIQERGGKPQHTEVVTLNAAMADVATENDLVIASVRFSGLIREEAGASAESFDEIWHIQKSASQANASWFVSGIQQVS
ncbi:MAG: TIM44-like domain-containing protein [Sulfuricellaceae bacterium]|nr:TIM44-like domain-containing protein [Sulfuricellaceae bacterium]